MVDKTLNNMIINVKFDEYANHTDNLVSKESLQVSLGKIKKWKTDFHSCVWNGNAATVNNHTVLSDVPADAAFTDTIYTLPAATDQILGGVIIGDGINVTQDGTISVDQSIIPDVPEELGVMDLQVKEDEVGILTSTKPNNVTEDLDILQYLGVLTLNVGFESGWDLVWEYNTTFRGMINSWDYYFEITTGFQLQSGNVYKIEYDASASVSNWFSTLGAGNSTDITTDYNLNGYKVDLIDDSGRTVMNWIQYAADNTVHVSMILDMSLSQNILKCDTYGYYLAIRPVRYNNSTSSSYVVSNFKIYKKNIKHSGAYAPDIIL